MRLLKFVHHRHPAGFSMKYKRTFILIIYTRIYIYIFELNVYKYIVDIELEWIRDVKINEWKKKMWKMTSSGNGTIVIFQCQERMKTLLEIAGTSYNNQ